MSEESAKEITEPWDQFEDSTTYWGQIRMRDLVWSDLPTGAADAIERVIRVGSCKNRAMERVHRLDPQTIEVVWYDDVGEGDKDQEPSRIADRYIIQIRQRVQEMFGTHWRVRRKEDGRRDYSAHPQRAIIRRADHQRFQYQDESDGEYMLALHGRPDGVPDHAEQYGDLDHIPDQPSGVTYHADVWVYETPSSGTIHLVKGFRSQFVSLDISCMCGSVSVDAQDVVDGELDWYPRLLAEGSVDHLEDLDPVSQFDKRLCSNCAKSYKIRQTWSSGEVRNYDIPDVDWDSVESAAKAALEVSA